MIGTILLTYAVIGVLIGTYEAGRALDPVEYYPDHTLPYRIYSTFVAAVLWPFYLYVFICSDILDMDAP